MTTTEQQELIFAVTRFFSPTAPINKRDLFAGRVEQMSQLSDAVNTRGQHAVIYGERGVGKTSLANIVRELLDVQNVLTVKVNCDQDDNFPKVWRKALSEISLVKDSGPIGFGRMVASESQTAADHLTDAFGPDDLRRILQALSKDTSLTVFFDEFDRVEDEKARRLFADTIKNLSDNSVDTTLVLVGVANNVDELIKEHASVDRALAQIQMPRMSVDELKEIINKALLPLGMTISDTALDRIVIISQGLPHYTHLLGKESAIATVNANRRAIADEDVAKGVEAGIKKSQQSIQDAYHNAIRSQRKGTLFRQVLLACAVAEVDDTGCFAPSDVRGPLSQITGEKYDIPWFSQHLDKFANDPSRGPVLEKRGTSRRYRFRFRNPLLQPYVIMRGLSEGMLVGKMLELLRLGNQR